MSLSTLKVISPPYWGTPNLSHHFPLVAVVVTGFVVAVVVFIAVVVVLVWVVLIVEVEVAAWVEVVVVEVVHDASIRDITIRLVMAIQVTPFFIQTPSLFWQPAGKR
jgi:hypothetical protein